jgi:hypothetical protein
VARSIQPDSRVVYVDIEPTAVVHARAILGDDPNSVALHGDLQHADAIIDHPEVRRRLDPAEPLCVLLIGVLHFIPDSPRLAAALRRLRDSAAAGSYLAISHATRSARPEECDQVADLYTRTGTPLVMRDRDQITALLDDWTLLEPGVVYGPEWRPDPTEPPVTDAASYMTLAGVARKP